MRPTWRDRIESLLAFLRLTWPLVLLIATPAHAARYVVAGPEADVVALVQQAADLGISVDELIATSDLIVDLGASPTTQQKKNAIDAAAANEIVTWTDSNQTICEDESAAFTAVTQLCGPAVRNSDFRRLERRPFGFIAACVDGFTARIQECNP